ncbi:MAG: hypothetical protein KGI27_08795 [Thaumarchaeota archaeon]|nr:hypothetical protein [Nitrososphaerota archaeon]
MKAISYILTIALVGTLFAGIHDSYAQSSYDHALFGGISTQQAAGQNMGDINVKLLYPQTFVNSGEDHNWHLDVVDNSGWTHNVGYYVNNANQFAAFFDEEIFGGTLKHNYQGMTNLGSSGSAQDFALRYDGTEWDYYFGPNLEDFSTSSPGTSFDTFDTYALAEQICPTSPNCTSSSGRGSMPVIDMPHAVQYANSVSYPPSSWNQLSGAQAYYQAILNGVTYGNSQSVLCPPMSMAGHDQISTLASNELETGDNVVGTCTAVNVFLWP